MSVTKRELALKSRITDEFLSTILEAGICNGNGGDVIEVFYFIGYCYGLVNKDGPTLTEFMDEVNKEEALL